jgi:hypothetical protein
MVDVLNSISGYGSLGSRGKPPGIDKDKYPKIAGTEKSYHGSKVPIRNEILGKRKMHT